MTTAVFFFQMYRHRGPFAHFFVSALRSCLTSVSGQLARQSSRHITRFKIHRIKIQYRYRR
ncbi:hypothetical protein LZ30DRAFT_429970 [Colletotrichum cereale]|nr:hypothetical protein LZ30DRAFT_429970 [Colletotrichum cereale]